MVRLDKDAGLETLAARLGFKMLDERQIGEMKQKFSAQPKDNPVEKQLYEQQQNWLRAIKTSPETGTSHCRGP